MKCEEASVPLRKLPPRSPVFLYRHSSKTWEGPFNILHIEGETDVIHMRYGRKLFSYACMKPFVEPAETSTGKEANKDVSDIISFGNKLGTNDNLKIDDERRRKKLKQYEANERNREERTAPYVESRASELTGLIQNGIFKVINRDEVAYRRQVLDRDS